MLNMDKVEAKNLIAKELDCYREKKYDQLVQMIKNEQVYEVTGPSGKVYQVEIQAFWDSGKGGNIRVVGSIDNGGWRAFCPLCKSFIKTPCGDFLDE